MEARGGSDILKAPKETGQTCHAAVLDPATCPSGEKLRCFQTNEHKETKNGQQRTPPQGRLSWGSHLWVSLGHTGRRRVVLGHTANTLRHIITKRSHHVLSTFTISCGAESQPPWATCGLRAMGWTPWKAFLRLRERGSMCEPERPEGIKRENVWLCLNKSLFVDGIKTKNVT